MWPTKMGDVVLNGGYCRPTGSAKCEGQNEDEDVDGFRQAPLYGGQERSTFTIPAHKVGDTVLR